jgi:hypothetical protein
MNRVVYDMQQSRGGVAGFRSFAHESAGFVSDVATIGQALVTRGMSLTSQKTSVDVTLRQGLFYDPEEVDVTSYGVLGYYQLQLEKEQSPRQDMTSVIKTGQIPKTRGGTKSSGSTKVLQTSKPFWSNGKPKCPKGFRYDFKRKMCVRKS